MKLKKLVAITLSAVMCMAALTGCGGKSDSAKKTAKVIEVDLTDEQYDVIKYYPMPGRSWRLTGTFKF